LEEITAGNKREVNDDVVWSMNADTADYSESKNGSSATGLLF
jgi:Na+/melibiose symporter-like transporter